MTADSYSRTPSGNYGGPTIAYGDPRAVTSLFTHNLDVRTSGVGSYGAASI